MPVLAALLFVPPALAAFLALATPLFDPGPSGEWAPIGHLFLTGLIGLAGAIVGFALAIACRDSPRWRGFHSRLPLIHGLLVPAAAVSTAAMREDSVQQIRDGLVLAGLAVGGGAGLLLFAVARLAKRRAAPPH